MTKQMEQQEDKIQRKVEEMGVFFEKSGLTPIHGRVFAYLLLSEPPYKDFYEIQEFLKASKSAISNALKYLMNEGMVDYITFSGDRRRYFRVSHDTWIENYKRRVLGLSTFRDMMQEVLEERQNSDHLDFNKKLERMLDLQSYIADGVKKLVEEWEAKQ